MKLLTKILWLMKNIRKIMGGEENENFISIPFDKAA
jgi:hypothetical protein